MGSVRRRSPTCSRDAAQRNSVLGGVRLFGERRPFPDPATGTGTGTAEIGIAPGLTGASFGVYSSSMLVIRDAQFDAIRRGEWRSFLRTIAAEARAILVAQGHPRAAEPLESAVEDAVKLAQRYGFRARPHLSRFAGFVVVHGPGWETPAVRAALSDDALTAEAKLDCIEAG